MYSMFRLIFRSLTLEFLSSFEIRRNGHKDIVRVSFRLINQDVDMSIRDFGRIFGLYVEHNRLLGNAHNNFTMWGKLTGNYEPASMQHFHASQVQHPVPIVFLYYWDSISLVEMSLKM